MDAFLYLNMLKAYYHLTKPGIIYGNAITAAAGFFLAGLHFPEGCLLGLPQKAAFTFLAMLIGLSLVIASGCVFNNIWDSDVDAKMDRTKNRAMVTGQISKRNAAIFGAVLIFFGVLALHYHVNNYALGSALVGFIIYVFFYTPLKRKTVYATLIGAIAGATPPVVGYTSVINRLDAGAVILFLILVCWQMPHFYSIAIYRLKDYAAAQIPVLPVKKGIPHTKAQMLFYIIAFLIAAASLTYFKFTGYVYLGFVMLLGLIWLWMAVKGFKAADDILWAKKMFRFSLVVITLLCVIITLNLFLM